MSIYTYKKINIDSDHVSHILPYNSIHVYALYMYITVKRKYISLLKRKYIDYIRIQTV